MNFHKLAAAIQGCGAVSTKAEKTAALSGMNEADLQAVRECLNPYRVFNVKKWDAPQAYAQVDAPADSFFTLLNALHDRVLTGNTARAAVTATLEQYTEPTAEVLAKVILKDFKCGADTLFGKVYPTLNVPSFELMLAAKIDEKAEQVHKSDVLLTEEILAKKYGLTFPMIGEAKYDGNRLLAMIENGSVTFMTRGGRTDDRCAGSPIEAELLKLASAWGKPIVVDGEVLARSFQETMNARGSDAGDARANLRFYAFDIMTLADWKARDCQTTQIDRSLQLEHDILALELTHVIKSKWKVVYDLNQLKAFYSEVLDDGVENDGSLNGRGEGLIIKKMDGLYEWDRSKNWFKWKPVIDVDLKIVGKFEGKPGTKNEGKLGGFFCEGTDENGRVIKARAGGMKVSYFMLKEWIEAKAAELGYNLSAKGNSPDQFFRQYAWDHFDEFEGRTAYLQGQELTKAQGSEHWSLRFPVFHVLRDDK